MMDWRENLSSRSGKRVKNHFQSSGSGKEKEQVNILTSSSDWGVVRNGGRRGAIYGSEAILNAFKSMATHGNFPPLTHREVGDQNLEAADFNKAQEQEINKIKEGIKKNQPIIHIGGGHDHIYPLVTALFQIGTKKIHVINIDAHLDTRQDPISHSGTPFRQINKTFSKRFRLTQIGIHPFANIQSNYTDFHCPMEILTLDELRNENGLQNILQKKVKIDQDEVCLLSLDCDALNSNVMEAVSAVNHNGLHLEEIHQILTFYLKSCPHPIFGLYEYNPKYDNLSNKGARTLAAMLYRFCLETLI